MSIITLTTDFGVGSPYVAAMKGVILSINPKTTIVDLTHAISPQDVREGAIVLEEVADRFPEGTIHVVVVDPGVGTRRAIVYARIGGQQYIAPDNGVLSRVMRRAAPVEVVRLENDAYWLPEVSATFHGRDIMAPVAAHLSLGVAPRELGPLHESLGEIAWPVAVHRGDRVEGVVLRADSFGNLVTNITADMLLGRPTDGRACVVCHLYETWGIYQTYGEQPRGTLIALIGSNGALELAIVGESAAERLALEPGTPVVVAWE
ncbi:MAG TPA: SAM-dependent chlorinase/fluorinase [Thermoguttaceae bacterium]|nr:SAM-dependent chlorinase/fluorinase [Thermoguttaceae bacterium]